MGLSIIEISNLYVYFHWRNDLWNVSSRCCGEVNLFSYTEFLLRKFERVISHDKLIGDRFETEGIFNCSSFFPSLMISNYHLCNLGFCCLHPSDFSKCAFSKVVQLLLISTSKWIILPLVQLHLKLPIFLCFLYKCNH